MSMHCKQFKMSAGFTLVYRQIRAFKEKNDILHKIYMT